MADECGVSEVVTEFLLYTCRLPPRPNIHDVQAVVWYAAVANDHLAADDEEADFIPLITGSIVEFYIEPLLPHIGDINVMFHCNTLLAIPRGHTPPTQLPAEFHNYVYVFEITDSQFPGYVYLPLRYLLTQRVDDGKYEYIKYDEDYGGLLSRTYKHISRPRGPALTIDNSHKSHMLSVDIVLCVRCLTWPPQAADWPTRPRNYRWPDSATLVRVVSNGCDAVNVGARQCRQHECINSEHQWRLSFSRAEIVLINSWTPVQQIVYHMLLVFMKTERLADSVDNSEPNTVSNYHIKTLMLWTCELKPSSWWTENLNLVRICVDLWHTLSIWLTETHCPHYFINCNLLDESLNVESMASKLMSVDEKYLSTWFMKNYIGQCSHLCPFDIVALFYDASTRVKLQNAVSEIVCWRLNTLLVDTWRAIDCAEYCIPTHVSKQFLTAHSCTHWKNELTKIDKRLSVYFSAVALLQVARRISRNSFSDELVDILTIILGRTGNYHQWYSIFCQCKTELNTSELVEFLQKSAVEHLTAFRQLIARDFGSFVTIVTTDFETLYAYKRGDYRRCLQLSIQNVHTLLYADSMPFISISPEFIQLLDDDIVSLTVLTQIVVSECKYVTLHSCITQLTLSLYLVTRCQLILRRSPSSLAQTLEYIKVAQRRHPADETPLDQLILKLTARYVEMLQ